MTTTTGGGQRTDSIRPFRVDVSQAQIDDLRQRINATRFPEKETVDDDVKGATVPAAVSVFPHELYQAPRSWTEQAYPNLMYFNEVDAGQS